MLRAKLESIRLIRQSGLFDAAFNAPSGVGLSFMPSLPPELAYLGDVGAWKRSTSALFDGGYYLANNADVRNSGMNPLAHYISHGYVEGRSPSALVDIDHIARQLAPPGVDVEGDEFEEHKRKMLGKFSGLRELLIKTDANPHVFFDNGYYRKVNAPHVTGAEPILLEHYIRKAGRTDDGAFLECTPYADLNYYMDRYSDLSQASVTPLMHLVKYGLKEGRTFNDLESVSQAFLDNTAALTGDPAMGKLSEFIRSCGVSGRLAGPYWPTPYASRSIPALDYEAPASRRRVFIGVVLYENSDEEVSRIHQSILNEIAITPDCTIDYIYLVNDAYNLERYRKLIGDHVVCAPESRNVGFGRGHNLLMSRCFVEDRLYIGANPDGYFTPGCVRSLANFSAFYRGQALIEASTLPIDHPKWHDPVTLDTQWVSGACFAMARELWAELGGFDENIHMYCEDVDISWRARLIGGYLKVCPTARFVHDVTPRFVEKVDRETASRRRRSMLSGAYYLAQKWGNTNRAELLRGKLVADGVSQAELQAFELQQPGVEPALAQRVADFSYDRFAPSRFW